MHIVAYCLTHTTSLVELQEGLQKLQKRYEAAGSKVWSLGTQDCKPAPCIDMHSHACVHVLNHQIK